MGMAEERATCTPPLVAFSRIFPKPASSEVCEEMSKKTPTLFCSVQFQFSSVICTLRARRLAPCGVSPLLVSFPIPFVLLRPSVVSHHLRRLSPPLLASRAHSIGFR
jgi:hypothetical protein